jgi:hypothetical protein
MRPIFDREPSQDGGRPWHQTVLVPFFIEVSTLRHAEIED